MKTGANQSLQTAQRVRVGMIGLAAVVLLIGLASALFSLVRSERPVAVAGAAVTGSAENAALLANSAVPNEPLAELGAAPAVDANAAQGSATK